MSPLFLPPRPLPDKAAERVAFAIWLRAELARTGLTQQALARAVGTDQTVVADWLTGSVGPGPTRLSFVRCHLTALPTLEGPRFVSQRAPNRATFVARFGPLTAASLAAALSACGGVARLGHEIRIKDDAVRHWCKRFGLPMRGWGDARYRWKEGEARNRPKGLTP